MSLSEAEYSGIVCACLGDSDAMGDRDLRIVVGAFLRGAVGVVASMYFADEVEASRIVRDAMDRIVSRASN